MNQLKFKIANELSDMQLYLERAEVSLYQLTNEYFGIFDKNTDDGKLAIMWEYNRSGVHADIVSDYLFKVRQDLAKLLESMNSIEERDNNETN